MTDADDRSGWVSHGIAALAVSALGLLVAGSISVTGPAATSAGVGRQVVEGPDVTRAEPQPQVVNDDRSQGSDSDERPDDERGTLDTYDKRQRSTSRDTVREQLAAAGTANKSRQRTAKIGQTTEQAQNNNRGLSATDRDAEIEKARAAAAAEAERQLEEERRKAAEKAAAELAAQQAEALKSHGLMSPEKVAALLSVAGSAPAAGGGGTGGPVSAPLAKGTYQIGAHFGQFGSWARYHTGQDFPAAHGTPIRAIKDGVVRPGVGGWAGNDVVIQHAGGDSTLYAHMSQRAVSVGQTVKAGQVIGFVGSTGRSFGAHLHLEHYPAGARPGDVYSTNDPMAWMRSQGVSL